VVFKNKNDLTTTDHQNLRMPPMETATPDILINHDARWLMDIVTDAMLIADADGHILQANPAAERLFGYTPDNFTGLTIEDLIPQRFRAHHGEKRAAYATQPTPRTMGSGLDIFALRRDGIEFPADVSLSPLEDARVLVTVYDITRRKQAEQSLAEARALAENIVATLQEPLVVLDNDARVVTANRVLYQEFRLTEEETLGQIFYDLNERQWDIPALRELVTDILPIKHKVKAFELQHEFPGVGSRTVFISARLIEGQAKGQNLTVLTFRNISDRRQMEAEQASLLQALQSTNAELRNFAYVVSHDLKAPLRAIGSLADWIMADQHDRLDAEGQEHLRLLIQRARRMDALIDGVLSYSRIGRIREAVVAVDLNERVREVIDALAPPDHIAITVSPDLPVIRAEKTAIYQVLQNLIANAVRYLDKPQGQITIGCSDQGESWQFCVADNGPGIEMRHFERIFLLFQTLNSRDRVESTGVGLSIVKKIVELFGGQVWLESTVGEGSTFYFTVPKGIPVTSEK
jgi:two-component system, LuxR family, sensor kinase FixL